MEDYVAILAVQFVAADDSQAARIAQDIATHTFMHEEVDLIQMSEMPEQGELLWEEDDDSSD